MARVSIYLNFDGDCEEAFTFYRSLFGGEFAAFQRMSEVPPQPGQPELREDERERVMHVELPILGGVSLMGTDVLESMGHTVLVGNNTTISLEVDTLEEGQRLFGALSDGSSEAFGLQKMFWGAWWGTCLDRFGIRWMVNVPDDGS